MLPKSIAHYCQKCLAANPLGQELCGRCGTRLMLVVEPPAMRFEQGNALSALPSEEHLLERVSSLENVLLRVTERMERTLDLLLQQARNSHYEHALVKTLIEILSEAGAISANDLDARWIERCQKQIVEAQEVEHYQKLRAEILAAYRQTDKEIFTACVEKSIGLICKGELKGGVRELERAAALAPDNAPLNSFLGEHFFREGKQALARDYLQRAFDAGVAKDSRVPLLLGIACADEADTEQAKTLLDDWIKQRGSSFAAHYALGKLFAGKELWREALAEFKRALVMRPSPEAHYLIGAVYYQLKHNRMAERHLRKALALDAAYAAAHYLFGLVLLRANDRRAARQAFDAASAADPETTLYRTARESLSKTKQTNLLLPLTNLFGIAAAPSNGKGLVSGADLRLALLVREDALQAQQRQIEPK